MCFLLKKTDETRNPEFNGSEKRYVPILCKRDSGDLLNNYSKDVAAVPVIDCGAHGQPDTFSKWGPRLTRCSGFEDQGDSRVLLLR